MAAPSRPTVLRVDFNNADARGRVRLNTVGALEDIAALPPLHDGMPVLLVDDEMTAYATLEYGHDECVWTAHVRTDGG